MALTEKEKLFCKQYIACKFNGTQAAINAGYSKKTAAVIASENLRKPNIQKYLSELIEKHEEKTGVNVSKDRVLLEISRIALQDARQYFDENGQLIPIHDLSDDAAAALAGFEVEETYDWVDGKKVSIGQIKKIKRWDKNKPLEMLAKIHNLYSDAPVNNNNITPFSDTQVDKLITALRETKGT
jgi:phage terminase small subunit